MVTVSGCLLVTVDIKVTDGDAELVSRKLDVRELAGERLLEELVEIVFEMRGVDDSHVEPELDEEVLGERFEDLETNDVWEKWGDDVDETVTTGETDECVDAVAETDTAGLKEEDVLPVDERDAWPEFEDELVIDVLRVRADDDDGDVDDLIDRESLGLEDVLRVVSVERLAVTDWRVVCDSSDENEDDAVVELETDKRGELDDVALFLIDGVFDAHPE